MFLLVTIPSCMIVPPPRPQLPPARDRKRVGMPAHNPQNIQAIKRANLGEPILFLGDGGQPELTPLIPPARVYFLVLGVEVCVVGADADVFDARVLGVGVVAFGEGDDGRDDFGLLRQLLDLELQLGIYAGNIRRPQLSSSAIL
eukprot:CAMPEP_0206284172 /NCGR_PEP_ID=MMETSP0047_2-20121206/40626_1 /ASSEMBLY_ACC=CAM_ASM_000192 /TAXON_ID=195065 /ORGANISM="Chroomonas mesostigmatica_cf, Strain CCMP1168" /LENGTH=143 /DNA_ID=CAMNT_0053714595 /DNA_START=526 /DNA_END=957 /DNA_ORIENTATION=-